MTSWLEAKRCSDRGVERRTLRRYLPMTKRDHGASRSPTGERLASYTTTEQAMAETELSRQLQHDEERLAELRRYL